MRVDDKWVDRRRVIGSCLVLLVVGLFLFSPIPQAFAQTDDPVLLTIRLRASDGTAVAGEPVVLERLPEETMVEPACQTDTHGQCRWPVTSGLYQLLLARPLDPITTLALAEGGLRGFGLTVGERPVTYHFTLHQDGVVYFDAAPEAAIPVPIIPESDGYHGGVAAIVLPPTSAATGSPVPVTAAPAGSTPVLPTPAGESPRFPTGRLLLLLCLGLLAGGLLHLATRWRRPNRHKETRVSEQSSIRRLSSVAHSPFRVPQPEDHDA